MSGWSFIAQRADTREFLHWELPLELETLEWGLSGPGSLTATISPDEGALRTDDGRLLLEEWGTLIHVESDGLIRWSGILISSSFEGEKWALEAAGYSTYPHAVAYEGEFVRIGVDPVDVLKEIWSHIQSFPDGDLGVSVVGDVSPVRLGKDSYTDQRTNEDGTVEDVAHEAEPYSLVWWDSPNCGEEIADLVKTTPLDYVERHYWDVTHEDIVHEIAVSYPRIGRRREDLLFAQDANVTKVVHIDSNGDEFANGILGLGAGEGRAMLRRSTSIRDGRLRRTSVYADKAVTDPARLDALIAEELSARKAALRITSVEVTDHPNAPIGSWQIGDDVLVQATIPWLGEVEMWVRITGWALTSPTTATLTVSRSDLFHYGG